MTTEPTAEPRRLSDLRPAPYNPREIGDRALEALGTSLEVFGDLSGIVWNRRTGALVAGHQRAQRLGDLCGDLELLEDGAGGYFVEAAFEGRDDPVRFPVRVVDWDLPTEKAANLAANSPHLQGRFTRQVDDLVRSLKLDLPDVVAPLQLDRLLRTVAPRCDVGLGADSPEAPKAPVSEPGRVYQLGPHRLLCGDSLNPDLRAALYDGVSVDCILTDPPYCSGGFQEAGRVQGSIGSQRKTEGVTSSGRQKEKAPTISRDNLTTVGVRSLLQQAVGGVPCHGCCYVFSDWRQHGIVREAVEPLGYQFRSLLVWDKEHPGMGGPWRHQYELVFFGTRRKEPQTGKSGDLLRHRRSGNPNHPTEKPVGLLVPILENTKGSTVADPFAGSGSTLIAAAEAGWQAFVSEVTPEYCDVIRRRWYGWAKARGLDPGPDALPPRGAGGDE